MQQIEVELEGSEERRPALADVYMVGPCELGDQVVVNVSARDLGLGSGGFDLVHVNLTRGLTGSDLPGAHVMKLNYSTLQHPVPPVAEGELEGERRKEEARGRAVDQRRPVAVLSLHGQLPPVVWAAAQERSGLRVGYIQTLGGALPGALSKAVRQLRDQNLICSHITAGPTYGGEKEAVTLYEALRYGFDAEGWDAAVCAPGPGILGSASRFGHGGMYALDSAHTAAALGLHPLLVPRMSSGDLRERHRGLSHHSRTTLELLLTPVTVAWPDGEEPPKDLGQPRFCKTAYDLEGYAASGLPTKTMGRGIEEDRLFFASALAGGTALAQLAGL